MTEGSKLSAACAKMPLDARIVAYWAYFAGFISFVFGVLLLCKAGYFPDDEVRLIAFGLVSLTSESSFAVYFLFFAFANLVCGYGLARRYKFGWWLMLILSIYTVSDFVLALSDNRVATTIGICINLTIIGWLICRRRVYRIGVKAGEIDPR